MANFKRRKPLRKRTACGLCKPHKRLHAPMAERQRFGVTRRLVAFKEQVSEILAEIRTR